VICVAKNQKGLLAYSQKWFSCCVTDPVPVLREAIIFRVNSTKAIGRSTCLNVFCVPPIFGCHRVSTIRTTVSRMP
jgi:hypothetical protein